MFSGDYNITNSTLNVESQRAGLTISIVVLAVISIMVNSIVLLASKYTTGGKSPGMAYVRTICASDIMVGMYGMIKALYIIHPFPNKVNCFLGESILFTSQIAGSYMMLGLVWDCYRQLSNLVKYHQQVDKEIVLSKIIFIWNVAFVIGFLPQMGWHRQDYICQFFGYHADTYLSLVFIMWITPTIGQVIIASQIHKATFTRDDIQPHRQAQDTHNMKIKKIVRVIHSQVISMMFFYLPFWIFIFIYEAENKRSDKTMIPGNIVLTNFAPFLLIKATIGPIFVVKGCPQIKSILAQKITKCCNVLSIKQGHADSQSKLKIIALTERQHTSLQANTSNTTSCNTAISTISNENESSDHNKTTFTLNSSSTDSSFSSTSSSGSFNQKRNSTAITFKVNENSILVRPTLHATHSNLSNLTVMEDISSADDMLDANNTTMTLEVPSKDMRKATPRICQHNTRHMASLNAIARDRCVNSMYINGRSDNYDLCASCRNCPVHGINKSHWYPRKHLPTSDASNLSIEIHQPLERTRVSNGVSNTSSSVEKEQLTNNSSYENTISYDTR